MKLKIEFALILIAMALLSPMAAKQAISDAPRIVKSDDKELVYLFNNIEIIAEHNSPPLHVTIFQLRERGECQSSPETCPKSRLYVGVSSFDEDPDQVLYVVDGAYGCEFIRWISIPKIESKDSFLTLELGRKEINANNLHVSWWKNSYYILRVNLSKATIDKKE